MAKKRISTIDVTGLSVSDIMNISIDDFNKLNESDLRRLTSRLVSASNKRVRAIERMELMTPAYRSLGTDVRFSTKLPPNIDAKQRVNALRQEFSRARSFLSKKTSTIRGYEQTISNVKKELMKSLGVSKETISGINISKGFELFHKLQESGQIPAKGTKGSSQMRDYLFEQMVDNPDISDGELMKRTEDYYDELYEEQETEETTM